MDGGGSLHCTGDKEQDHSQEKEMQKAKWLSEEALQIVWKEEKWKAKEKRKDINFWMQSSKEEQEETGKPSSVINAKK